MVTLNHLRTFGGPIRGTLPTVADGSLDRILLLQADRTAVGTYNPGIGS